MKKSKKVFSYTLSGLAIIYGLTILFPQVLFSNKLDYKNFTVYFHSKNMDIKKLESILDKSIELLGTSDMFEAENNQNIFLCSNFNEFAFFAPRSRKSFAVNYPLVQNIFLSKSNVLENNVERNGGENNLRTLSGVIAHETIHSALENKLGLIKYKLLPSWKNEGYCDFVAKESSYNEKLGWTQICENNEGVDSPSFTYFKYKTYVQYLLKEEKVPLDTFLTKDFNIESIAFESRKAFCPNLAE